jgi:hypothetical protein
MFPAQLARQMERAMLVDAPMTIAIAPKHTVTQVVGHGNGKDAIHLAGLQAGSQLAAIGQ